jgi:hypothetical protein
MNDDRKEVIRARHFPADLSKPPYLSIDGPLCDWEGERWPCEAAVLLAEVDRQAIHIANLEGALLADREHLRAHVNRLTQENALLKMDAARLRRQLDNVGDALAGKGKTR